jgi:hypothetical protein
MLAYPLGGATEHPAAPLFCSAQKERRKGFHEIAQLLIKPAHRTQDIAAVA